MSVTKTVTAVPLTIDHAAIKQQARWLMDHTGPEAEGLLSLLDTIRDYLADELGVVDGELYNLDTDEAASG